MNPALVPMLRSPSQSPRLQKFLHARMIYRIKILSTRIIELTNASRPTLPCAAGYESAFEVRLHLEG